MARSVEFDDGQLVTLPVIVRSNAEADIQETYEAYQSIRAGLGDRFLQQLQEVFVRIEFMPELFGIVWEDVRAARLKRFRHVVYYVVFDDRVEVLAVMHGARDSLARHSRV